MRSLWLASLALAMGCAADRTPGMIQMQDGTYERIMCTKGTAPNDTVLLICEPDDRAVW